MIRLVVLLLACSSVNSLSKDVYERQRRAATLEAAGDHAAAASERQRIARDQARLQRREMHVPSWQFPQ
jgi:hypothetical protein